MEYGFTWFFTIFLSLEKLFGLNKISRKKVIAGLQIEVGEYVKALTAIFVVSIIKKVSIWTQGVRLGKIPIDLMLMTNGPVRTYG